VQRTLTIIGIVVLFVIGAVFLVNTAAGGGAAYQIPTDPVLATVLLVSIVVLVVLTVVVGFGLARGFGVLSKELTAKHDPDDRPDIETKALGLVERIGNGLGSFFQRFGYGENAPTAPYTPNYSYKAQDEKQETRQFLIGFGLVMLLFVGYAVVSQGPKWVVEVQKFDPLLLGIGIGSVLGMLVLVVGLGVGLAIWFQRTVEEQQKAAQLKEPAWPAAQIVELEHRIKSAPATINEMTFLDKSLIALNVGLLAIFVGAIALWVVPGMMTVSQVDQALHPKPTDVPAQAVSLVPPELQKEIDALPAGNAAAGKQLIDDATVPCATCHKFDSPDKLVGPSLTVIGTEGATRKPGYSARAYIYESITEPGAFVVPSYQDGLMPPNFKEILSAQQIADLVAYLETLK
jgi:mono/diheme cytochrome c family protein